MDLCLLDVDVLSNSLIDTRSLKIQIRESYMELEVRLEEKREGMG